MDATKRKTLIEWINSLAVAESIESLRQLHDGRHILALTNLIEGIPQQSDIEGPNKRWENVINFLEGLYHCSMSGKIDVSAIARDSHEFEIGKVCLLVMSAAMLCERNGVFVDRAMQMETNLQHEIREMVEWVMQPNQNLSDLDPCFHQVLSNRLNICAFEMKDLNPQASSTPQNCNQRSRTGQITSTPTMNLNKKPQAEIGTTPVFSTSILGRFTSPGPNSTMSPMSPVQQLVQSPNIANKVRLQQKEQRIKLLERELNAKRHLVSEYESEIEEKRKDVDSKERSLIESRDRLQQALKKISKLQSDVDDLRQFQDVSMGNGPDYDRLVQLKNENGELLVRNRQLEEENLTLYNQIHSAQEQVDKLDNIREKMSNYQARLHSSERDMGTLRAALEEKNQLVVQLSEATERAHCELASLRDTHQQELIEMRSQLERATGAISGTGESLGGVMEMKYVEELEALKSEMAEYEEKLQQKAAHVLDLLTKTEQLTNKNGELMSLREQLMGRVEQLSNSLKITQQNLTQSQETSKQWEEKAQALETTLEELQNTSNAKIRKLESQVTATQQESQSHLKQLAASQEAINNLQSAMQNAHDMFSQQKKNLCEQIQNSEQEMAKLEESLHSTENSLKSTEEEVSFLRSKLVATQQVHTNELQSRESSIASLHEELKSQRERFIATQTDLTAQVTQREGMISDLTSQFEDKQKELSSACEQLQQQSVVNEALEEQLKSTRRQVEQLVHKSEVDHSHFQEQRKEFMEQFNSKSEELAQVISARAQDMEEFQVQRLSLEDKLSAIQIVADSKNTALTEHIATLQESQDRVTKLETTLQESENEKVDVQNKLISLQEDLSKKESMMTQQNEKLHSTVMSLSQNLSDTQGTLQKKENALVEVQKSLSTAEAQINALQQEVKHHEEISAEQKHELSRQLEMATMSGDEQRESVQRLSLQLQEVSVRYETSERKIESLKQEYKEKENLWNTKVDEFERKVGDIYELRQQVQENEVELRQLSSQNDALTTQLNSTEITRDAFKVRVQEQESTLANLNQQLLESETLAEEEKTKTAQLTQQINSLEVEKTQMRQELDGECERSEAMEMELMETQQTFELKEQELQVQLEDAMAVRESLQSELVTMRMKAQVLEEQFEMQNEKMANMVENIKQLGSKAHQQQLELTAALELREQVMNELDEAQFKITSLQEELEESKERNSALEHSIEQHKENAETFEARLREFMEEKTGEISTLETELIDTDNKLRDAKLQAQEFKAGCINATSTITNLEEALKVAQESLFITEKEKSEAMQDLEQSRLSLSGKVDHLGAMQDKVSKLKEELEASDARVQQLQETLSIYEQKSADLERKHQEAETQAERKEMKLEGELEQAQEEIEELTSKVETLQKMHKEAMDQVNQEQLALKEARLSELTLKQELHSVRIELSTNHHALQNMEVQQAGQMEQVLTEGNNMVQNYEQKINQLQECAAATCQSYEAKIVEMQTAVKQTEDAAEEKIQSITREMEKLKDEQKEEVKVLGRQIEALTSELQDLKCWEISERSSVKELEAKCTDLEEEMIKAQKEVVQANLKLQSKEKLLSDLEVDQVTKKTITDESITKLENELDCLKQQLMDAQSKYTNEIQAMSSEHKGKLSASEEETQQAMEQYQQISIELQETHAELEEAKRHHHEELEDLEERCAQMQEVMEKQISEKGNMVKKHENEIAHLKEVQFQEKAERDLSYELESERLESEILQLKADVAHKQDLLAAVERKAADTANGAHAEIIGLEKDKLALETQLESRDRHLKAAKEDANRAMRLQEMKTLEVVEQQKRVLQLEREIHKMMEREKRHLEAHRRETSLGADMNAKLQQEVNNVKSELENKRQQYNHEVQELTQQVHIMQEKYQEEIEHLEQKNEDALDKEMATLRSKLSKLEERHARSEAERQQQIQLAQLAEAERDAAKDQVKLLETQLKTVTSERDHTEEQLQGANNLKNQLREEEMLNKRLNTQVRSLEAQLDHATRQLKAEGKQRSLVPPPQPPPFPETPATLRRSLRISNIKETDLDSPSSKASSDEEFAKPHDLRSNKSSEGTMSLKELTTTPSREGRYLTRLSFHGSMGPTPRKRNLSASSTHSATSLQSDSAKAEERRRSMRLSISSTSSHESVQSNPPFVATGMFSMEDEPVEFEWDRLSELQRRNTLCLPHMKSSYPAEMQTVKQQQISEMDLQRGEPLETTKSETRPDTRSKARKRTSTELSDENATRSRRKTLAGPMLAKSSTATLNGSSGVSLKVYKHYSPHLGGTPKHKLAKNSPVGSPAMRKPETPTTSTSVKRPTPKANTPKRNKSRKGSTPKATPKSKDENVSPKTKAAKTPMSFNIGFTPKKAIRRLPQVFRRKKPEPEETPKQSKLQAKQSITKRPMATKPLGDHNRH